MPPHAMQQPYIKLILACFSSKARAIITNMYGGPVPPHAMQQPCIKLILACFSSKARAIITNMYGGPVPPHAMQQPCIKLILACFSSKARVTTMVRTCTVVQCPLTPCSSLRLTSARSACQTPLWEPS